MAYRAILRVAVLLRAAESDSNHLVPSRELALRVVVRRAPSALSEAHAIRRSILHAKHAITSLDMRSKRSSECVSKSARPPSGVNAHIAV